jgi:hypothetical protein
MHRYYQCAIAAAIAMGAFAAADGAAAREITITGAGAWDAATPVTGESAPNESWAFSFQVPSPTDTNPTAELTNFSYALNGVTLAAGVPILTIDDLNNGGGFDLFFADGTDLSFLGPNIGGSPVQTSNGETIAPGEFATTSEVIFGVPDGSGTIDAVPEPASWALLLVGFGLTAAAATTRRRDDSSGAALA